LHQELETRRRALAAVGGTAFLPSQDLVPRLLHSLPFDLTGAQQRCIEEIGADLEGTVPMRRLLHGDVGSGKTMVALCAALRVIEQGWQVAIMAPTEILAEQHFHNVRRLVGAIGMEDVVLFKGGARAALKRELRNGLASGATRLVVGTHALIEDDVEFSRLGLAIVDEQHRFGVAQRARLSSKGTGMEGSLDVLIMTATPIPRTLSLTAYGDMDVSRIMSKPPGRQPVDTRTIPIVRLDEVAESMRRAIDSGARIYWVCPLVSESELIDLAAAEDRAVDLRKRFGKRVGLAHGQMKGAERDDVMARFAAGDLDILVATTVIEVGVDVPEATVMIIEHAERFGLAQLHQLRGRVGRGAQQSTCLLLYAQPLGETAQARLAIMRETDDGFRIAEEDLRLRGAGEVLGTRQSGLPDFRLADIEAHQDLLQAASDDAQSVLETDPELKGPRGQALRVLLYLFEREAAVRYLRSG